MSRQRKCVICGEPIINENDSIPYKGRYAHNHCFDISLKVLHSDKDDKIKKKKEKSLSKPKPKIELKDAMSEEEYADKKLYYSYLRTLLDNELSAKIYTLSDGYIKKYGFTFKQMYNTLVYLYEIKHKELIGDIVGLIPYYLDEAEKYYSSLSELEIINSNKNIDEMYAHKMIQIKPKHRTSKLLDITTVGRNNDV